MKYLVMIVPNLPPAIDGIGDYAFNLAQQLDRDYNCKTRFIVGSPNWIGEEAVKSRSSAALTALLPATSETILLHYAGHGYAKRGCPVWLVQALAQWCKQGGRLVTMFHELYATNPLLSSALITSPFQKHLAIQLMQMSDHVLTSRVEYAEKIQHFSHHTSVPTLPIFSTVGELSTPKPLEQRSRQLVVFGGVGARSRVYQCSREILVKACQALEIREVIDIGPRLSFEIEPIQDVQIKVLGIQPVDEISCYLSQAIAGFLDYSTAYLGKSTIFAAYCSHGVIPITGSASAPNRDELIAQKHYWLGSSEECLDLEKGQAIADSAFNWYESHSLKRQSIIFAKNLTNRDQDTNPLCAQ